jgi:hypothetical protein
VKKLRNLIMVGKCLDIVGRFGFEIGSDGGPHLGTHPAVLKNKLNQQIRAFLWLTFHDSYE